MARRTMDGRFAWTMNDRCAWMMDENAEIRVSIQHKQALKDALHVINCHV